MPKQSKSKTEFAAPKKVVARRPEPTVTVGDSVYNLSDLSDEVKELLSLHDEAAQIAAKAKREAAIHEIAVANLAALIDRELDN